MEYNEALCKKTHDEEERRISMLEVNYKELTEMVSKKFDNITEETMKRLPTWASLMLAAMSALVAGLAVASIRIH